MSATLTFYDTYLTLDQFDKLGDEVSFHFIPSGVVIEPKFSTSPYAVNVRLTGGVTTNGHLHTLLTERGYEPNKTYEFYLVQGSYYEANLHGE